MSAEFLPTGKPRWAVTAWVDHHNVFIEIPVKDQAPFIAKYLKTPEGFREALTRLMEYHAEKSGPPVYVVPPRIASTPSPYKDDTRAKARAALVKAGILK
jgi:hypothetical protein